MFDYNTIQKTVETQFKNFASAAKTKEMKEIESKSKEFAVSMLDASTKATLTGLEAFGKFAGPNSTTYLLEVTKLVDAAYENAKEIIQTGTIKGFAYAGDKK